MQGTDLFQKIQHKSNKSNGSEDSGFRVKKKLDMVEVPSSDSDSSSEDQREDI